MEPHSIYLTSTGDLKRGRLTTFFRAFLALPHHVVLAFYAIGLYFVFAIGWIGAMVMGKLPNFAHTYTRGYLIYNARVASYSAYLAEPWPPFGPDGTYDVDLFVPEEPRPQSRLGMFFRGILAIPSMIVMIVYMIGFYFTTIWQWLCILVTGKAPAGTNGFGLRVQQYAAQLTAYMLLITNERPKMGEVAAGPPAGGGGNGSGMLHADPAAVAAQGPMTVHS